jgi:ABC-type uncharacterized transport system auxiliary subunit
MLLCALAGLVLMGGCASAPVKQYFTLNYTPSEMARRSYISAFPFTIRLKDFDIEDAYSRPQIVYRQNPFQLEYYSYKLWAVKPTRMITDLVQKHLLDVSMVSHVVRRLDEAYKPDYELGGVIEALEEYDSDKVWFAHLAIRIRLTRLSDSKTIYSRSFDKRKQVFSNKPEDVVKAMSEVMEFVMNQACQDMDGVLARELGVSPVNSMIPEDTSRGPDGNAQ